MKKALHKSFFGLLSVLALFLSINPVFAADSASVDGIKHTVRGSVNDSMFSGSVTGELSTYASATITDAYYYDNNGISRSAPSMSGSPYVSYSVSKNFNAWKWNRGYVEGKTPNTTKIKTRLLIN